MKSVVIAPQQIQVAAPAALIMEVVATAEYGPRPNGKVAVSLSGREAGCDLVAFTTQSGRLRRAIIKEMTIQPPSVVSYRHRNGPFAGASERLHLYPDGDGTRLQLTAEFAVPDADPAYRLRAQQFEHAALEHLLEIQYAVRKRSPAVPATNGATAPAPLPILDTEQQLLAAIARQEEAEWGHAGHGHGVARVAVTLAEAALLPARQVDSVRRAALLHDAGKLALDSALWGTRGTLAPAQRALMEAHSRIGREMAVRAGLPDLVASGILHHHERWDGTGYPDGLAGEAIPLRGRILFLAEAIDSMIRATYRRQPMGVDQVVTTLERGAGHQWDPSLARTAVRIMRGR